MINYRERSRLIVSDGRLEAVSVIRRCSQWQKQSEIVQFDSLSVVSRPLTASTFVWNAPRRPTVLCHVVNDYSNRNTFFLNNCSFEVDTFDCYVRIAYSASRWADITEAFQMTKRLWTFPVSSCCGSGIVRSRGFVTSVNYWTTSHFSTRRHTLLNLSLHNIHSFESQSKLFKSFCWLFTLLVRIATAIGLLVNILHLSSIISLFCLLNNHQLIDIPIEQRHSQQSDLLLSHSNRQVHLLHDLTYLWMLTETLIWIIISNCKSCLEWDEYWCF